MTDPISDMFNQIKNAQAVGKTTVEIPFSKIKFEIARVLRGDGWIESFLKKGKKAGKSIKITLKFDGKTPEISNFKRMSRPGRRVYKGWKDIKVVRQGFGTIIISTPKGLMTGKEARKQKLGGEIICEVW